jgi:hypothetical protein
VLNFCLHTNRFQGLCTAAQLHCNSPFLPTTTSLPEPISFTVSSLAVRT